MGFAVKAENLGKKYLIGHQTDASYSTLRDSLVRGTHQILQRIRHPFIPVHSGQIEEFWALKDLNFEIQPGDRIGIIGRNGAGKSTLLKILSRITEPSTGRFTTIGRVASLLEVGTGFHPELTGRENIYLNGAILGMTRADVKRQFDAIVDFSGVEKFLDTPVKRYSSGMYVRLAFSVAAHLEPDILIVDEVLAVGDAEFQKKCLGKMEDVGKEGRTVIFVSHNMGAVRRLCDRGMLIENGTLKYQENTVKLLDKYQTLVAKSYSNSDIKSQIATLPKNPFIAISSIKLTQAGKPIMHEMENGKPIQIHIEYEIFKSSKELRIYFDLLDESSTLLVRSFFDEIPSASTSKLDSGRYQSTLEIPADFLAPTTYYGSIMATRFNIAPCLPPPGITFPLQVLRTGRSNSKYPMEPIRGKIAPFFEWQTTSK